MKRYQFLAVMVLWLSICTAAPVFASDLSENVENTTADVLEEESKPESKPEAEPETEPVPVSVPLAIPQIQSAESLSYNMVRLKWQAVPGATSYRVYYKETSGNGKWKLVKSDITGTSFSHKASKAYPLLTGVRYSYTVRAVNDREVSGYNKEGKTVIPALGQPVLAKVTSSSYNRVKITWKKVDGAQKYIVYKRVSGKWKRIGTTKNLYFSTSVRTGALYCFTVKALRNNGRNICYSKWDKQGIKGKAIPNKTVLTNANCPEEGKISLTWKVAAGADGYVIYRKNGTGKWERIVYLKGSNRTTYTHVSSNKFPIKAGQTYVYTIRSYTSTGKTYGQYDASGKKVKALSDAQIPGSQVRKTARSILSRITNDSMSKSEKLYAAWKYVTGGNFYYRTKEYDTNRDGWHLDCAQNFLTTYCGDCYGFATGFAALAKEIGYSPYVVMGRVSGTRDGAADGLTRHGWVRINGLYYDPEAQYAGWYRGVYGNGSYDIRHTIQRFILF